MQLPLGILLDRYGPRRVQSVLLLVAAAGAYLFGMAHGFWLLVIGRGLIGLGVAGALIAGLKAIVFWFPKERIPLVNGFYVMLGALGAVTATAPAELLLAWTDWRGLFALLAIMTASCALGIYSVVPDAKRTLTGANDWLYWPKSVPLIRAFGDWPLFRDLHRHRLGTARTMGRTLHGRC